ncbi:MAG: DUF4249 family protein [Bacteroidota bacterium]
MILIAYGCTERIDVNAPPKDIWVVYAVLDPQKPTQDLRIGKAFQIEENAFTYAETFDPAVKGLSVKLTGGGESWEAFEVDSIQKGEGDFTETTSIYRFETEGNRSLQEGVTYKLQVSWPDDSSLQLSAQTRIPPEPKLLSPQIVGVFSDRCLMPVRFEDTVQVVFKRKANNETLGEAYRFQLSVRLNYTEDGDPKVYRFGPTRLFSENVGCGNVGGGAVCYEIPGGSVLRGMLSRWSDPMAVYAIDDDTLCGVPADLSRFCEVQVTAVDTSLGRYMSANDPFTFNLNTYRPEYTNIEGNASAVGVFGSINYENIPVNLTECARYQLGINPFAVASICK